MSLSEKYLTWETPGTLSLRQRVSFLKGEGLSVKTLKITTQMGGIFATFKPYLKDFCWKKKGLKTHIIFHSMNKEVSRISLNRKFNSVLALYLELHRRLHKAPCCCRVPSNPCCLCNRGNARSTFAQDFRFQVEEGMDGVS